MAVQRISEDKHSTVWSLNPKMTKGGQVFHSYHIMQYTFTWKEFSDTP